MIHRRLSQPPITSPAWILMRSFSGMLISSSSADSGSHGHGLDIGDCGGTAEHANISREWRLQTGVTLLSLQRLDKSCLLTTDVGSGTAMNEQIKVVSAATGVLPQEPGIVGLSDGHLEVAGLVVELSSDVDVAGPGSHGSASHQTALHQCVRIVSHNLPVLASSGLSLVIDDQILGSPVTRLVHEGPLHTGGESGTTTASQSGGLDLIDDPVSALLHDLLGLVPLTSGHGALQPG